MTITKEQFKQIAKKASSESNGKAQWIAIDRDGAVWAYNIRPFTGGAIKDYWVDSDPDNGRSWKIGMVAPPDNFRDEIYEISKLLDNDTE